MGDFMNILKKALFIIFIVISLTSIFSQEMSDKKNDKAMVKEELLFNETSVKEFSLKWRINGQNLDLAVSAKTTGWIAVGFEPTRIMKDADIIIGYVDNKNIVIEDHFADKFTSHKNDTTFGGVDNITNVTGSEKNGITTIEFTIPLNSGDKYDKVLIPGKEYKVIFAYGTKDNLKTKHRKTASVKIKL